jgi:hypothetical protein
MSLSAEERLITIRVKIKRAKEHLAELEGRANTYRNSYRHVVGPDERPGFAQGEVKLRKLPIIHFDMLAIAGDVAHNLRSSLDHLVYHLALVYNPDVPDEVLEKVAFPIGQSLERYESLRRRKLDGVIEPAAIKLIDGLKPYKGGNDVLWRLQEMNNIDKHRRLISVGTDILCDGDGFEGYYWLRDENPSFASVFAPERQQKPQRCGVKALIQPHADEREALIPSLQQMTNFVDDLIEHHFKVFLEQGVGC